MSFIEFEHIDGQRLFIDPYNIVSVLGLDVAGVGKVTSINTVNGSFEITGEVGEIAEKIESFKQKEAIDSSLVNLWNQVNSYSKPTITYDSISNS